jgi:pimeloyl-ACP methyl ester carboxylesterase
MGNPQAELLLLHALPLDGSMWAAQADLLPGRTFAPMLYGFGESIEGWAAEVLKLVTGDRVVVVGCSVGGSCAIEVALMAPERVGAVVLVGTKAAHRPDPASRDAALEMIEQDGLECAWESIWSPMFSTRAVPGAHDYGKCIALRQSPDDVAKGIKAFHSRPSRSLSDIGNRVIVVTGEDDRNPGRAMNAEQAALARDGRLHVIADCGHYVPLEQPQVLNSILREIIGTVS